MELRPFVEADGPAMQELQSRIWPLGVHPGGLGWLLATQQLGSEVVTATGSDGLAGWGALSPPGELTIQVAPEEGDAAEALLDWPVRRADGPELSVVIHDDDSTLQKAAAGQGFVAGPPMSHGMWLNAESVTPDAGAYVLRSVEPAEYARRIEAHRASWRPADLPFHPDHRPALDEKAESSFSSEVYARCRSTWLYEPELDLVAVAPDGSFAATCLAWLDRSTGVAELEPMGVHPHHRRRGLAGALCHEVARRVRKLGGSEVFINAGPREDYPAPAAYTKAGFRTVRRGQTYRRSVGG